MWIEIHGHLWSIYVFISCYVWGWLLFGRLEEKSGQYEEQEKQLLPEQSANKKNLFRYGDSFCTNTTSPLTLLLIKFLVWLLDSDVSQVKSQSRGTFCTELHLFALIESDKYLDIIPNKNLIFFVKNFQIFRCCCFKYLKRGRRRALVNWNQLATRTQEQESILGSWCLFLPSNLALC